MITETRRCVGLKMLTVGLGLILAGCDGSEVVIRDEVKSPDGSLTAQVRTRANSGPGNSNMTAEVNIFQTANPHPVQVLLLTVPHDKYAGVKVKWHGNNALEIVRHPETKIDFQAVKVFDVDISLR
jgi:hypothetical protein